MYRVSVHSFLFSHNFSISLLFFFFFTIFHFSDRTWINFLNFIFFQRRANYLINIDTISFHFELYFPLSDLVIVFCFRKVKINLFLESIELIFKFESKKKKVASRGNNNRISVPIDRIIFRNRWWFIHQVTRVFCQVLSNLVTRALRHCPETVHPLLHL